MGSRMLAMRAPGFNAQDIGLGPYDTAHEKMAAVGRGRSMKDIVVAALEKALDASAEKPRGAPLRFPLVRSREPGAYTLSPGDIHDILLREEAAADETAGRR